MNCLLQKQLFILLYQMKEWNQELSIKLDRVYQYMPLKKEEEEWMTMIYGMESLNVFVWTSVQKLFILSGLKFAGIGLKIFKKNMGSNELLQSDLVQWLEASVLADTVKVVRFDEMLAFQKPWAPDTLYTRWMIQLASHASQSATNLLVLTRRLKDFV
ncbi:hypothetical protein BD769DRAFT_1395280 [Suillus cothurnatus]|nr:hypothetical protein BD769DRAFT_1395280 [Suillus cothurnatus]